MQEEEKVLLEKAVKGDFEAFAALCEPCRESVCSFLVQSQLADEFSAEDVFMDALLKAKRSLESFRAGARFETWLTTIARNIALDRRRAAAAHPIASLDAPLASDSESSLMDIVPDSGSFSQPGEGMDSAERARLIRAALAELPEETRSAMILFYFDSKPYNQIAQLLGIPLGTVMSRLHNGKKKLLRLLEPHMEDLGLKIKN